MKIPTPYLVFLGDAKDFKQAKTAFGLKEWRPELCLGQFKLPECEVTLDLNDMSPAEAATLGAKTFVIAISPFSTTLPENYIAAVEDAIRSGLHIANPLHGELPESINELAAKYNVEIFNFRHRSQAYPKATGAKRPGLRLLTVGTDCACGKKYTACSISRELSVRDVPNTFRSTGQTGFLISDSGINNDTIQADFLSGAAEWLTPANVPYHWDVVEGQGAVSHPSFGAGSVSLLYGTQPDVIVMCHEPGRKWHRGVSVQLPILPTELRLVTILARRTNPDAKVYAVSLFTKYVEDQELIAKVITQAKNLGLFVFDPNDPSVNPDPSTNFSAFIAMLERRSLAERPNLNKHGAKYV